MLVGGLTVETRQLREPLGIAGRDVGADFRSAIENRAWSTSDAAEETPTTHPDEFDRVRGSPAKINPETGEVWDPDQLHKNHWEVYSSVKDYENGVRDRAVWNDGRLKQKF